MSSISNISSLVGTPTPPPATAKNVGAAAAAAPAASATVPAAQPAAAAKTVAATAAALPAGAHRNSSGDTVSLSGVVLVDHDGDGGVGQQAAKPKAPASSEQGKLANLYSAH